MVQTLVSSGTRYDLDGNTIYCKALKTGYYAGGCPGIGSADTFGNVNLTTATTLSPELHQGVTVGMNSATGFIVTLPAATGTGNYYDILVSTTVTSGNHVVKTGGSDVLVGTVCVATANGTVPNITGCQSTNSTITMSGSTTGGLKGSWLHFVDIASGVWFVEANLVGTGTPATPVS
jgi:hypothetical protein